MWYICAGLSFACVIYMLFTVVKQCSNSCIDILQLFYNMQNIFLVHVFYKLDLFSYDLSLFG